MLEGLGHTVDEADPAYGLVGASFMPRSMSGIREWVDRIDEPEVLDPRTRHNATVGKLLSGPLLAGGASARAAVARANRQDLRATSTSSWRRRPRSPPCRSAPPRASADWATDKLIVGACPYAWPWNVIGWPGVNVPAGLTDGGLPIGVSLLGPANSEALLISLAAELEAEERWHERRPPGA